MKTLFLTISATLWIVLLIPMGIIFLYFKNAWELADMMNDQEDVIFKIEK